MKQINKLLFIGGFLIKKNPKVFNLLLNFKSNSLRIVYYHIVSNKKLPYYFDNKSITLNEFEYQIKYFKKYFDIINLNDAILLAKNGSSLNRKLVITFDDGFHENYTIIAPLLIKYKIRASFFLIGNCIDNKDLMWRNKLLIINKVKNNILRSGINRISAEHRLDLIGFKDLMSWSFRTFPMDKKEKIVNNLWQYTKDNSIEEYLEETNPYMTVNQIRELSDLGFEFGSHSMSHPNFSKIGYEEFKNEIVDSKIKIEKIINKRVNSFTYPFGNRASVTFEMNLLKDEPDLLDSFLGTRNRLNNLQNNIISWERDNLEFSIEIAISRFLLVSALRSL